MAADIVAPFRKSQGAKNDRNDAQAILTAVRQPDMRFLSVKSVDQQAMLAWHSARAGSCRTRTEFSSGQLLPAKAGRPHRGGRCHRQDLTDKRLAEPRVPGGGREPA